jgi:hypothetical protein
VLAAGAIVVVVMTGGGDDPAVSSNPTELSIASTDSSLDRPGTSVADSTAPTSDPVDVATSAPTASTSPEAGDTAPSATLVTVPVDTVAVLDPIPLDETADAGTGLEVRLLEIEAIDGEARAQGEVAGPALRVHVEVTNTSDEPISLERTQVEVTYGEDRAPGIVLSGSGTTPFPASVAPGDSATAIVVFVVPLDQRDIVQVAVTQTTGTPIILFEGSPK